MGYLSKSAAALAGSALLVAGSGAWALASSSDGTITVCVSHHGGGLYKARRCAKHDRKLKWNRAGPKGDAGPKGATGPAGAPGQSVTSSSLSTGDANCPDGGTRFTSVSGATYACNGAPATRLWAVVSSAGTLLRGSHASSASAVAGGYEVDFDRDVSQCSYQATLGATSAEIGEIGVGPRNGNASGVFVFTADSTGAQTAHGFNLAVNC
jgi:outer membrane protein assembly factor BamB